MEQRRFGPSNDPGTCLWCGYELVRSLYFCSGRCGFMFGRTMAKLGWRLGSNRKLVKVQPTPPGKDGHA